MAIDRARIFTIVDVLQSHKDSIEKIDQILARKDKTVEGLHKRIIEQAKALARVQGVEYVEERPEGSRSQESAENQEGPKA